VEQQKADLVDATSIVTSPDDTARFLRELRQLRDEAGLGHAELAARAHYPYDIIVAAEAGPGLPDLPVLSAYVRGCDGTTEEWEERWRALTKSPADPLLPTRDAGNSPAADAGARVGTSAPITDADPSIIIAALSRVAEEMAGSKAATLPITATAPTADAPAASESVFGGRRASAGAGLRASAKPAGWDPIRVSTAWPALRDTTASDVASVPQSAPATGPWAAPPGAAAGQRAPWDVGTQQDETAAPASNGGAARGSATGGSVPGGSVAGSSVSGSSGATGAAATARASDSAARASRAKTLVVAAVLLCVLVVLLAIFA